MDVAELTMKIGIRINGSDQIMAMVNKDQIESMLLTDYQKSEPKGGET
jgi:hypothetical protein